VQKVNTLVKITQISQDPIFPIIPAVEDYNRIFPYFTLVIEKDFHE